MCSALSNISKAVVFGGAGGFGRVFAERLSAAGIQATTVDNRPGADIEGDISADAARFAELVAEVDLVLLCLPQEAALNVLCALDGMARDALLVDICSVKTVVAQTAATVCLNCEYVSFHPMFGPDRVLEGSNGVFMPIRQGRRALEFRTLVSDWGVRLIDADVQTHDRVTSLVQVVTHAVLATFANVREQLRTEGEINEALVEAFATPIFAELERVSQGMVHENPALYHNIQTANPWGDDVRKRLSQALTQTLEALSDEDVEATRALFARIAKN